MIFDLGLIFSARVLDVSLNTMRTILMVKGRRYAAAICGFFEVLVYIIALSRVFGSLGEPIRLAVYAAGFSTGIIVGSLIEERLALGYLGAQIITPAENEQLVEVLREARFGVTTWSGRGRTGEKLVINVLFRRSRAHDLEKLIIQQDEHKKSFVVFSEPKMFRGGFMQRK